MTYEEFFDIAKTRPWKVTECFSGPDCWCRIIKCDPPVLDYDGEELTINTAGSMNKLECEYIVELHNQNLIKNGIKIQN